jgi:fido (protein-threonine AMPylation protein)
MVSKYDIFYVIASSGETKISDIIKDLNKSKKDYHTIFNYVLKLEKGGYIKREKTIKVLHNERSKKLFEIISFCIRNKINYNLMLKDSMINFIGKAAKKEFFTIKDIKIHPQTYKLYVVALSKYGFLFMSSKKPLKCKLLRHHFLIDIMKFFNKKYTFYNPKHRTFVTEIKKELKRYKSNLRISPLLVNDFEKKEEANFVYSSLNLEGNPLTLPETQKLVVDNVIPSNYNMAHIQEVTNYKKAVDLMLKTSKSKIKLDLNLILRYHEIAMSHINEGGTLREQNVRIGKNTHFKTSDWKSIKSNLDNLMLKYKEFESTKKDIKVVIEFASFFHNEFQRIHPFIDGNSRTSRLLMLHILRSHRIPLMDIPLGYFDLYLDLTKRSKKRDDKLFTNLIEEIIYANLRKINEGF